MRTKINKLLAAGLVLGGSLLTTSCFEEGYDIDEVDMTVGTTLNLTIPIGSTGGIYLKNIIELEEDGVIQLINQDENGDGTYCVTESGTAEVPPIDINEISFASPEIGSIEATLELNMFDGMSNVNQTYGKRNVQAKATDLGDLSGIDIDALIDDIITNLPDIEYSYEIKETDANYKLESTQASGISADVVSITRVGIENSFRIGMDIFGFENLIGKIHAKNLTLTLPYGFDIAKVTFGQNNSQENTISKEDIIINKEERTQLVKLTGSDFLINPSEKLYLTISFTGLEANENSVFQFFEQTHEAIISECDFTINGAFSIKTKDIDVRAILGNDDINKWLQIQEDQNLTSLLPSSVTFHGDAAFEQGSITLKSFSGKAQHDVGDINPIVLDDLPDFLNDDDVVLDLQNPMIFITTKNAIPAVAKTNITLTSIFNGASDFAVSSGEISIPGGGEETIFCLTSDSCKAKDAKPQKFLDKTITYIEIDTLNQLIYKIPKEIRVNIAPVSMEVDSLDITESYEVNVDYEVYAPLTFGPNFKLVYRDTEDGLSEDLNEIEDVKELDGSITIKAQVDSDLEAALILTVIPLDKDKNEITDLKADIEKIPARAKNHEIEISIKAIGDKKLSDILLGRNGAKQLDGITYEARIEEAIDGATLKSNNSIRLHDIKLAIEATASVDAEEL